MVMVASFPSSSFTAVKLINNKIMVLRNYVGWVSDSVTQRLPFGCYRVTLPLTRKMST